MFALAIFTLIIRLGTLMTIDTGVDERDYWYSGTALIRGLEYPELTHRTVRFSVVLPLAAAQAVFGSGPNTYYVVPVLNSMLQAILFFMIGFRLRDRFAGFLASLGIIFFPYMIRMGSQVLPEGFSITYIATAAITLIGYFKKGTNPYRRLAIAGFWIFIAYEAKITNLFFLPGMALAVLASGGLFQALVFGSVPFGLFLAESLIYRIFSAYPWGQLQVIAAHHLAGNASLKELRFLDLFSRYASPNLQLYWQLPFLLFVFVSLWYLLRRKDRLIVNSTIMPAISFFFFITFAVTGFSPVVPTEPFINRYFSAVLVYVLPVLAVAISDILSYARPPTWNLVNAAHSKYFVSLALSAALLFVTSTFLPDTPAIRMYVPSPIRPMEHPLAKNRAYATVVRTSWDNDIPIVVSADNTKSSGGSNAIQTCVTYFLDYGRYGQTSRPKVRIEEFSGSRFYVLRKSDDRLDEGSGEAVAAVRAPFRIRILPIEMLAGLSGDTFPQVKE